MLARRARLESRTPLRRKTNLKARRSGTSGQFDRKARLPARRSTPRRVPAEYVDEPYLDFLRTKCCRKCGRKAPSDPHHARHDEHGNSVGGNMKDDRRACSLCRICHGCIDELSGPFKRMTRAQVHEWIDAQIAEQRAQFLAVQMVEAEIAEIPVGKIDGGDNYQSESPELRREVAMGPAR